MASSAASLAADIAACFSSDSFLASALAAEILAATACRASRPLSVRCSLGSTPLLEAPGLLSVSAAALQSHLKSVNGQDQGSKDPYIVGPPKGQPPPTILAQWMRERHACICCEAILCADEGI